MNLLTSIAIFVVTVGAIVVVAWVYRACQRNAFVFSIVDEKGEVVFPKRRVIPVEGRGVPTIFAVNTFLSSFFISAEKTIGFSTRDLEHPGNASLLGLLEGVDYETIRLRLRVMCSLNPVVNRGEEEGVIRMTFSRYQEVEFRVVFAAKGESILIEKQDAPKLAIQDNLAIGNP